MKNSILSGHVFVSAYNADLKKNFDAEINQLRDFRWKIGSFDGVNSSSINSYIAQSDILLINLSQFSEASNIGKLPALIIICEDKIEAQKFNAIAPDGFAILIALGGGKIEQSLADSVDAAITVDKVVVSLNWTMVKAGKYCGVARSPSRDTEGARTIRPENGFKGQSLNSLAQLLCSCDGLSRSVGLAAVNAFWNRPKTTRNQISDMDWGFASVNPPGDGLVVIGDFGGINDRLPLAKIVEREPKAGHVPVDQAKEVIANAKILVITGQTLMNGSLEPLLRASDKVEMRILLGPSVPLSPVLFEYGIDRVNGMAIHNVKDMETFICETGTMIMLDNLVQKISINR